MSIEPTVLVETPTQASEPETTPEETVQTTEEVAITPEDTKPEAERPNRSQERIRDTIAQKKEAERIAYEKSQEADYWKAQALANQPIQTEEYDGVTDEGIDPQKFAQSLEAKLIKKFEELQGKTLTQSQFSRELSEASKDPIMRSEVAQRSVTRIINSENVSPLQALELYKEEMQELKTSMANSSQVRNEAGQLVRQETANPSSARGSSGGDKNFTREQIASMDMDTYTKNATEINRQLNKGLIR